MFVMLWAIWPPVWLCDVTTEPWWMTFSVTCLTNRLVAF